MASVQEKGSSPGGTEERRNGGTENDRAECQPRARWTDQVYGARLIITFMTGHLARPRSLNTNADMQRTHHCRPLREHVRRRTSLSARRSVITDRARRKNRSKPVSKQCCSQFRTMLRTMILRDFGSFSDLRPANFREPVEFEHEAVYIRTYVRTYLPTRKIVERLLLSLAKRHCR